MSHQQLAKYPQFFKKKNKIFFFPLVIFEIESQFLPRLAKNFLPSLG
jgi:hypothetical protein